MDVLLRNYDRYDDRRFDDRRDGAEDWRAIGAMTARAAGEMTDVMIIGKSAGMTGETSAETMAEKSQGRTHLKICDVCAR